MNKDNLFKIFESAYFHELEMREKLTTRLQIPLSVIAVLLGFLAFMLRNKDPELQSYIFTFLLSTTALFIFASIICFVISWYSYKYKLLPTAKSTDEYRNELIELYKEYKNSEELVDKYLKEYLFNYYRDFSSINTLINDKKSFYLYLTNLFLIFSILLSISTFIPYYYENLDKSNNNKPQKVIITSPIKIESLKERVMTKKTPPPPPPPPPARSVRGRVITDKAPSKPTAPPPKPPSTEKK